MPVLFAARIAPTNSSFVHPKASIKSLRCDCSIACSQISQIQALEPRCRNSVRQRNTDFYSTHFGTRAGRCANFSALHEENEHFLDWRCACNKTKRNERQTTTSKHERRPRIRRHTSRAAEHLASKAICLWLAPHPHAPPAWLPSSIAERQHSRRL